MFCNGTFIVLLLHYGNWKVKVREHINARVVFDHNSAAYGTIYFSVPIPGRVYLSADFLILCADMQFINLLC